MRSLVERERDKGELRNAGLAVYGRCEEELEEIKAEKDELKDEMVVQLSREGDRQRPGRDCRQALQQSIDVKMQRRVAMAKQDAEAQDYRRISQHALIQQGKQIVPVRRLDAHKRPSVALET